jgi:diketogulonate reductase-like aldo/keto reductase
MSAQRFGPTGKLVPSIGQGTFLMEHDDRRAAVRSLRAGIDLGMTHLDTAEMYGDGAVEEIVADALEGVARERVFLVTKVLPSNASRKGTIAACEASLKRLRCEYVDCFLLHWPGAFPLAETIGAFEVLLESGKIRSYGVSNFDEHELEEAYSIAGPGKLACNQILYHLGERSSEHAVIPWCESHGVAVVGYTPFGRARFPPARGEKVLTELAARRGVTPRQLALAFLVRKPSLFTIPKASRPEHVNENATASKLVLDAGDIAAIDAAFPLGKRPSRLARI